MFAARPRPSGPKFLYGDKTNVWKSPLQLRYATHAGITSHQDFHSRWVDLALQGVQAAFEMARIGLLGCVADHSDDNGEGRGRFHDRLLDFHKRLARTKRIARPLSDYVAHHRRYKQRQAEEELVRMALFPENAGSHAGQQDERDRGRGQ